MAMRTLTFQLIILMHACAIVVAKSNTTSLPKFSSILVFGDSLVDSGNNNYINTLAKANHPPYGGNFPGHVPNGRFSNGKLVTDMLASALNLKDTIPPYLDPHLSNEELLTGVSFASAGSGIDEMTGVELNIISMSKQVEYFKAYVLMLKRIVGENQTKQILRDALVVICVGSNDFLIITDSFDIPNKRWMTIDKYQDYLLDKLQVVFKELYDHGCRKFGVTGLGPLGCAPYEIASKLELSGKCVDIENLKSKQYNKKLIQRLPQIQAMLSGSRFVYTDLYYSVLNLLNNPEKYGIEVTNLGCCGLLEILVTGPFCNEFTPKCNDASKYAFWDSFHFTEVSYRYLAKYVEREILPQFNF